jgi:hypothetical protein
VKPSVTKSISSIRNEKRIAMMNANRAYHVAKYNANIASAKTFRKFEAEYEKARDAFLKSCDEFEAVGGKTVTAKTIPKSD